jgi:hypothetical protein
MNQPASQQGVFGSRSDTFCVCIFGEALPNSRCILGINGLKTMWKKHILA